MRLSGPSADFDSIELAVRTWGQGTPIIVLHPLALESSAFAGLGRRLAGEGFRTIAVDLPGFGATPTDDGPLTPARLAAPVIDLAQRLRPKPIVLGMSLGGRVALEAALRAPDSFSSAVLVATYLPWLEGSVSRWLAAQMSPDLAERVPLDVAWPILKRMTSSLDGRPELEHDWLARASVRVAYYISCGATRRAMVSAARELALDPVAGADSVWSRLSELELPATFIWAGRDALIPAAHADRIDETLPGSRRIDVPCSGHFVNGRHFRCFEEALVRAARQARDDADARERTPAVAAPSVASHETSACLYRESPPPADARPIKQLSGEDAAFIYGETPNMPMHTIGTLLLDPSTADGRFDLERLQRAMASRIHLMPPLRQRLVEAPWSLARPVLADDPDFRLERHVQATRLPPPGTMQQLADLVASYAEDPLEHTRPLWKMWLVEGLQDGRVAVVTKMHHCMMDGASGANQMGNLLDLAPTPPPSSPAPAWSPPGLPRPAELLRGPYASPLVRPLDLGRAVWATTRGIWSRLRAQLDRSGAPVPSMFEMAPWTPLNGAITPHRVVAFASVPLADVKLVKDAFGVTVNDVVLAACSCALRRSLLAREALPEKRLVCGVPVSTKTDEEKQEFSNKVSMMSIRLPTDLEDPEEALAAVHQEAEGAKRAFAAIEDDLAGAWFDLVSPGFAGAMARWYSSLGVADWSPAFINLIISNVAGPPVPLYMAGARVDAIYPMGPVGEGIGLNITVLSNVDRVDIGVLGCRERVPDIAEIAAGVAEAVDRMKTRAHRRPSGPIDQAADAPPPDRLLSSGS